MSLLTINYDTPQRLFLHPGVLRELSNLIKPKLCLQLFKENSFIVATEKKMGHKTEICIHNSQQI